MNITWVASCTLRWNLKWWDWLMIPSQAYLREYAYGTARLAFSIYNAQTIVMKILLQEFQDRQAWSMSLTALYPMHRYPFTFINNNNFAVWKHNLWSLIYIELHLMRRMMMMMMMLITREDWVRIDNDCLCLWFAFCRSRFDEWLYFFCMSILLTRVLVFSITFDVWPFLLLHVMNNQFLYVAFI